MTNQEFALSELAARLVGTDATLSTAIGDIVVAAVQARDDLVSSPRSAVARRERVQQKNSDWHPSSPPS